LYRQAQGRILVQAGLVGLEEHAEMIVEEAFSTAAIEGENIDRNLIRSSVAKRLGLPTAGLPPEGRHVDGLVELLMDATQNHREPLTTNRLHGWQAALFPTGFSGIQKIQVGRWRKGEDPMQVISGPPGREKIHFLAPPSSQVPTEMKVFLRWWQHPPKNLDGLLRAGIAHFWFVTIHPYEDGNGRIARAITDMALSQDEDSSRRLYSLSKQIVSERMEYYEVLEKSQKNECDITKWLQWFLETYTKAIHASEQTIKKATFIAKFWQHFSSHTLNGRQLKVVKKLLEAEPKGFEGGLTNKKYVSITKVSRETAKRDLVDLENKGLLKRNPGKGRSISYSLRLDFDR